MAPEHHISSQRISAGLIEGVGRVRQIAQPQLFSAWGSPVQAFIYALGQD